MLWPPRCTNWIGHQHPLVRDFLEVTSVSTCFCDLLCMIAVVVHQGLWMLHWTFEFWLTKASGIFHIHIEIVWSSASTCLGFVHCFFPFLRSGIIHKFTLSVGWDGFCTCKLIQNKRWEERDARHLLHEGGWIDCLLLLVHITCFLQLLLHIHHHAPSSSSLKKKCRIQKTSLPKSQRMLVQLELIFNF